MPTGVYVRTAEHRARISEGLRVSNPMSSAENRAKVSAAKIGCRGMPGNQHAFKHGHARNGQESRTWKSWRAMHERCTRPKAINYRDYGGRGISVCERWNDYQTFLSDMGERPAGTSIDRINNDGNYEPGNCRWATRSEQQRNKRPVLSRGTR